MFNQNNLVTDKQWAYREGNSTELLLVHLAEIWRTATDANKVVAVAFVDLKKLLTVYLTLSYCIS